MLPAMRRKSTREHWVYLVECKTGELYVGQTNDVERRLEEHNTSPRGARFTSGRRPVRLRAAWRVANRGDALRVEAFIRRGGRARKRVIIERPRELAPMLLRAGIDAIARPLRASAPRARPAIERKHSADNSTNARGTRPRRVASLAGRVSCGT
jgi:putative endonuclease